MEQAQLIKIEKVKPNDRNPRYIKDDRFAKLVKSILDAPWMLEKRPIVVDETMTVLGGNMRLRACKQAGLKEVPVIIANGWSESQKREFIVKDNVGFGEWDWDMLANEWDAGQLSDWGLDVPEVGAVHDIDDYSDKNKEIDMDSMESDMTIKLKYTEEDYWLVKEALSKIASTPEQAVYKLLGL